MQYNLDDILDELIEFYELMIISNKGEKMFSFAYKYYIMIIWGVPTSTRFKAQDWVNQIIINLWPETMLMMF